MNSLEKTSFYFAGENLIYFFNVSKFNFSQFGILPRLFKKQKKSFSMKQFFKTNRL